MRIASVLWSRAQNAGLSGGRFFSVFPPFFLGGPMRIAFELLSRVLNAGLGGDKFYVCVCVYVCVFWCVCSYVFSQVCV